MVSRSGNQKRGCACSGSRRPRLRTLPRSVAPYRDARCPGPPAGDPGPLGRSPYLEGLVSGLRRPPSAGHYSGGPSRDGVTNGLCSSCSVQNSGHKAVVDSREAFKI